jgi:hypothetical protein
MGNKASLRETENLKFLILPGFELRPLGRSVRSQSLYLLPYPGTRISSTTNFCIFIIRMYYCIQISSCAVNMDVKHAWSPEMWFL